MKPKRMPLSRYALALLLLAPTVGEAAITMVSTGSSILADTPGTILENTIQNITFNAGATADAIIVALSSESNATIGQVAISYKGFAFTPVIDHVNAIPSIWLLNLSDTDYVSGNATLTLDMTSVLTSNGYGLGIVSINAGGMDIGAIAANSTTTQTVGLTTSEESFVVAAHRANNTTGGGAASSPLTQLFGAQIGSSQGAAGYDESVAAGTPSFSFTSAASVVYDSSAAAFAVIPEPSAALIGSLGLLALLRRRRI